MSIHTLGPREACHQQRKGTIYENEDMAPLHVGIPDGSDIDYSEMRIWTVVFTRYKVLIQTPCHHVDDCNRH